MGMSLLLALGACSPLDRTVHDIQGMSFATSAEFQTWLGCHGQWYRTSDGVTEVDHDSAPDNIVAVASKYMGEAEDHSATELVVRAGNVWVLVDTDGVPFGGLEPGQALVWCTDP